MLKIKELLALAAEKANAAKALLIGDTPNVEAANKLLAEADGLREQAEAIQKADGITEAADKALAALKAEQTTSGLVVVEDEADKALKAKPYLTFGEFLMNVKSAAFGEFDQRLLPLRSENGFSLNGAMGDSFVGGVTKSAFRKQTGLNEGVGAAGGFLVGTDQGAGIMDRVYGVGTLLSRVDMVGIGPNSNGMTFNAVNETSRVDGSRRGGIRAYWTAEAGTKVASAPAFRRLELTLQKVVGLVYATDELLQDASALESWINQNLPEELRFVVEDSIISGTGVGMPLGIIPSGAEVSVAKETGQAADSIVSQNIMKMWSRMWGPSRAKAAWYYNQDIEPQLMQLELAVGTGGVALYAPPGGLSARPYATLMGRELVPCEYCSTVGTVGDLIFADLSEYQMIEKGSIQQASSIHVQFLADETIFRFVYRCCGAPKWNQPLTPFKGTNTLSPFVTLAQRD